MGVVVDAYCKSVSDRNHLFALNAGCEVKGMDEYTAEAARTDAFDAMVMLMGASMVMDEDGLWRCVNNAFMPADTEKLAARLYKLWVANKKRPQPPNREPLREVLT